MESIKKILVVDDDRIMRDLMAAFFSEFKCEVTLATDADQAEDKLAVSTFDLVLTDLQMGYTSGLDVIRMVRHSGKKTVVFMMTGCKEIDSCRAAYEAGANKVFQKPLSMTMLQKNISDSGVKLMR